MNDRDAEREAERAQREADRTARRAERDALRAERDAQREERHRFRSEFRARLGDEIRRGLGEEIRKGMRGWTLGYARHGDRHEFGVGSPGAEVSDVVEKRFEVGAMPKIRVGNVSGETEITVGSANEVYVRARKRIHGWSEERAKRLLENVEIRMEQNGDEILIEPRLYEQERGWQELFRGGRVAVDLDVRVPRESHIEARTVSGELSLSGTRGTVEIQSVSGEVEISDVQGPLKLRTVSGDASATGYAGQLEANSVSGEIAFQGSRVRMPDIVTVSGDVEIDGLHLAEASEGRVKTVSGDVEIAFLDWDGQVDFKTMSGDIEVEGSARIEKEGRRDRRVILGSGPGRLRVKSVSGDLEIRRTEPKGTELETTEAEAEATPMPAPPEPTAQPAGPGPRDVLERLSRGELSVDEAAAALDASRAR